MGNLLCLSLSVFVLAGILSLYRAAGRRRLAETEEILAMMRRIRGEIANFSTPLKAILTSFPSPALDRLGFGRSIAEGVDFRDAVGSILPRLSVGVGVRDLLLDFSAIGGSGSLDDEIRFCDSCIGRMEELTDAERRENPNRTRVGVTVISTLSLLLLLLLW